MRLRAPCRVPCVSISRLIQRSIHGESKFLAQTMRSRQRKRCRRACGFLSHVSPRRGGRSRTGHEKRESAFVHGRKVSQVSILVRWQPLFPLWALLGRDKAGIQQDVMRGKRLAPSLKGCSLRNSSVWRASVLFSGYGNWIPREGRDGRLVKALIKCQHVSDPLASNKLIVCLQRILILG